MTRLLPVQQEPRRGPSQQVCQRSGGRDQGIRQKTPALSGTLRMDCGQCREPPSDRDARAPVTEAFVDHVRECVRDDRDRHERHAIDGANTRLRHRHPLRSRRFTWRFSTPTFGPSRSAQNCIGGGRQLLACEQRTLAVSSERPVVRRGLSSSLPSVTSPDHVGSCLDPSGSPPLDWRWRQMLDLPGEGCTGYCRGMHVPCNRRRGGEGCDGDRDAAAESSRVVPVRGVHLSL